MKTKSMMFTAALTFLGAVNAARSAEAKIEEQVLGPAERDAAYVISARGGHVATIAHSGSRWAVTVDGVKGPKFDEIMSVRPFVDPRGVLQSGALPKQAVFSEDGGRCAYVARQDQEFALMVDGKELMRAKVANPTQVELRMQFTGRTGKHLLYAVSGFAGFELWVDGQKMPGAYISAGGGSQATMDPLVSRDGARFAYVAQISRDKATMIVDGKDAGYVGDNLAFTADGTHLFSFMHMNNFVWLAVDGKPKLKTDGISQLVMAPEGNGFAAVLQRLNPPGQFLIVNAKKAEGSDCQSISRLLLSPDGKRYAALCSTSPSSKYVLVDGKKGQGYFDVPGSPGISFSADSSKVGYTAQAANKFYVVINDDESDGFDSLAQYAFSPDGKHAAYGGLLNVRPPSFPVFVDGKPERLDVHVDFATFAFSPDGSRHAYSTGAVCADGKNTGITGRFTFSPDNKHLAIGGRRGTDNKGGMFVDGKLVYESHSNFLIHYWGFTPDGQHLFWVAFEPPKNPVTSQGDFVTYLDGKPVGRYDNDSIALAKLDPYVQPGSAENGLDGIPRIVHRPAPAWQIGADGVLTFIGPVGDSVKRFRVTPSADTSIETMLADAK